MIFLKSFIEVISQRETSKNKLMMTLKTIAVEQHRNVKLPWFDILMHFTFRNLTISHAEMIKKKILLCLFFPRNRERLILRNVSRVFSVIKFHSAGNSLTLAGRSTYPSTQHTYTLTQLPLSSLSGDNKKHFEQPKNKGLLKVFEL